MIKTFFFHILKDKNYIQMSNISQFTPLCGSFGQGKLIMKCIKLMNKPVIQEFIFLNFWFDIY